MQSCAKTPPNLSPPGAQAFQSHEAQKTLDLIRDVAQDGAATVPPVISVDAARKITVWHKTAITALHEGQNGWQATVRAGLAGIVGNLSPPDRKKLGPYVELVNTILTSAFDTGVTK